MGVSLRVSTCAGSRNNPLAFLYTNTFTFIFCWSVLIYLPVKQPVSLLASLHTTSGPSLFLSPSPSSFSRSHLCFFSCSRDETFAIYYLDSAEGSSTDRAEYSCLLLTPAHSFTCVAHAAIHCYTVKNYEYFIDAIKRL